MTRRSVTPDTVYFIRRADGTGPIKIGTSASPEHRCKQLSSDLKMPLVVLTSAPGGYTEERALHRHLEADRSTGEWFDPSDTVLAIVAHVAEHSSLPEIPEYGMVSDIRERYLGGQTLREIGEVYGLTRERIRQILRRYDVPSLGYRPEHRNTAAPLSADEVEMARLYQEGTRPAELAALFPNLNLYVVLNRCGVERRGTGDWLRRPDTDFILATIQRLYPTGATSQEIADACGLPHATRVYRYLRQLGIKPARHGKNAARKAEAIERYRAGETAQAIADTFGVARAAVQSWVKGSGIRRTPEQAHAIRVAAHKKRARNARVSVPSTTERAA